MTIAEKTTSARNDYTGNGVKTNFSFTFEVLNEANSLTGKNYSLKVILTTSGIETEQVEDTDYTVTYDSSTRLGSITFTTAPASGVLITLLSDISRTQSTDYISIGTDKFPADSHEGTVDKLTLIARELDEKIDRAILLPESSSLTEITIPVSTANANKAIVVNSAGTDLDAQSLVDIDLYPISAFAQTLVDDTTAAEARTTLDAEQKANSLTAITSLQDDDQFIVADNSDSNNSKKITLANMQGTTSLRGMSYLSSRITVANNSTDSDHDIDFSGGVFNFDDGSGQAVASALTKQIDATWAAGDNQGGMEAPLTLTGTYTTSGTTVTGSGSAFTTEFSVGDVLGSSAEAASRRITAIASDTSMTLSEAFSSDVATPESVKRGGWVGPDITYHMFAIYNPTTDVSDYLFSASLASPTMPSGYTKKKRVASMLTNGSSNLFTFNQYGKYFIYLSHVLVNTSAVGTSRQSIPMDVPPNTFAIFNSSASSASGTITISIFTNLDSNDVAPNTTTGAHILVNSSFTTSGQFIIKTNSSGNIGARANNASSTNLFMLTEGFYDHLLD